MNKTALRTSVATALAIPAIVLGAGAASAQPTVVDGVPATWDAKITPGAGDVFGACVVTAPRFQLVIQEGTVPGSTGAGTAETVSGFCTGLPYLFSGLSGTTVN